MRLSIICSAVFLSMLVNSCTSEGLVNDFSDMSKLSDSLSQVYPNEDIRIKVSNGFHIGISFVNSDLKQLEKEKKKNIAKKVGLITRDFFDEKRIPKGNLTFVVYKNYVIFRYSEAVDTYELWPSGSTGTNLE